MRKILVSTIVFVLFAILVFPALAVPKNFNGNSKVENNIEDSIKPLPAKNKRLIEKVLPLEGTKDSKKTPPGQGGTPPGQEDGSDDDDSSDGGLTGILGTEASGAKYAVVVGICNYPGEENDICWSDGDSLNMYNALKNHYGFTDENIYLYRDMVGLNDDPVYDPNNVTDGAATAENINAAIAEIESKVESGDEVVFFFSGHGGDGNAEDGDNESDDEAIIVHNEGQLYYLWDGQLKSWFSNTGDITGRISFVFDSCLAGGMDDVAADGRVVSMATDDKQPASVYSTGSEEEEEPGEGVFSHYFVNEGILQAKADIVDHDEGGELPESSDVVVEEAFKYADDNISGRQKPTLDDRFTNDLLW